jgi:hypothetical protein
VAPRKTGVYLERIRPVLDEVIWEGISEKEARSRKRQWGRLVIDQGQTPHTLGSGSSKCRWKEGNWVD